MKTRQITLRECIDAWARGENTFAEESGVVPPSPIAKPGEVAQKGEWSGYVFNTRNVSYFVEVPASAGELREAVVRKLLDNLAENVLLVEYNGNIYNISRKHGRYELHAASDEAQKNLSFDIENFGSIRLEAHAEFGFISKIDLSFA